MVEKSTFDGKRPGTSMLVRHVVPLMSGGFWGVQLGHGLGPRAIYDFKGPRTLDQKKIIVVHDYWWGVKAMKPVLTYYELFVIVYYIVSSTLNISDYMKPQ